MRTVKDVEAYLGRLNRSFRALDTEPGTFLVSSGENYPPIALRVDPPIVLLRVHIGEAPKPGAGDELGLFRKLLQHNARGLVHASYGLEDNRVVLSSALELENLDFNELEAALDEIDLALAQQVPELAQLSRNPAAAPTAAPAVAPKAS